MLEATATKRDCITLIYRKKTENEGQDRNVKVFHCKCNRFFDIYEIIQIPQLPMDITFDFSPWQLLSQDQYFRGPSGLNDNGATWR